MAPSFESWKRLLPQLYRPCAVAAHGRSSETGTLRLDPSDTLVAAVRSYGFRSIARGKAWRSGDFLGESYEKSFGSADVAEPIRVFVLHYFAADELRAVLNEPGERLIDVVHGEHDA
jgi:hypothetical protein